MDITVDQSSLNRALRLAGRAVPSRPHLPILSNVVIETSQDRLILTASDTELAVVTGVAAAVAAPGRTAVPARLLADFVAQLPGEPVRLVIDGAKGRLQARCARYTATFATADAGEFPAVPAFDDSAAVDLDARTLRAGIERIAFAAARDDQRPVLTNVLFEGGADGLTLAACDGFRLGRVHLSGVAPAALVGQLLVSARAAGEFGRLLAEADAARLALGPGSRTLHLRVKDTSLVARLSEGQFPDIDRVIPRDWRTRVTVDAAALRQAVGVASLFGSTSSGRPVRIDAVPGALRLKARGDETGDAESELPAALEGEAQTVIVSTPLLADVLAACTGKQVELVWSGSQSPVVIREAEREAGSDADVWLVMPLHDPSLSQPAAPVPTPGATPQNTALEHPTVLANTTAKAA